MEKAKQTDLLDKIVSLCKRRGFVFPNSEIYGGLAGFWDYGHYGLALKKNIQQSWWQYFVESREDMYGMDAAIIMNQKVWQASGHAEGFADPMVECDKCKKQFRADQLERLDLKSGGRSDLCPDCGGKLGKAQQFNMMFKTNIGAMDNKDSISYLRPETAQGMFANFKNALDAYHPKLPFGLAQIGKAFRNEIAPRDFLFRTREFEQMEIEYFVNPKDWEKSFEDFRKATLNFFDALGLAKDKIHELEVPDGERAHYSKRTIDFEYDFPFGRKELSGLAYRTDFDLSAHQKNSGVSLEYLDEEFKTKFIPHVIEPSFGVDRLLLAILSSAYTEDEMNDEKRTFLKLSPKIAPVKIAVFPLLRNKPELVRKAQEVYKILKKEIVAVEFDDNGNIGKRYRRQDEIGTITTTTVDFETLDNDTVTLRERDSAKQIRVRILRLSDTIKEIIAGKLFSEFPPEVK
ncbi:MAG: glycyl-tRNA synthetase [Parcubacteria group bacterium Gr01-1014_73]|nr:MAG: glycyl-tRNA synthetase [Parcubacteria group bacterium Gr01-1014_73]